MPPTRTYQATEALPTAAAQQATTSLPQQQHQQKQSHKRKRDSPDQNGNSRPKTVNGVPGGGGQPNDQLDNILIGENPDFSSLAHHLQQHAAANNNPTSSSTTVAAMRHNMPSITIPQPTELSFQSTNTVDEDEQGESSFNIGTETNQNHHAEGTPYNLDSYAENSRGPGGGAGGPKPAAGTEEWHRLRRDNHKEVERRRRETINEGINELAKIVPGCDKNKGAILQRGVQYITQLKENEKKNIEKWTLEKMLTDQAISELSMSVDKMKEELARSHNEAGRWKKRCQEHGILSGREGGETAGAGGMDSDGDSLMDGK